MIFNSLIFLAVFLPIVFILFTVLRGFEWARLTLLLVASLVFYGVSGVEHLLILIVDILWVYVLVRIGFQKSIIGMLVIVAVPLLSLGFYKYLGFFLGVVQPGNQAAQSFSLFDSVIFPAGISFFTFQLISYAVDVRRKTVEQPANLMQFSVFVSFFPQLVAGPIVRYQQVADDLRAIGRFRLKGDDAETAAKLIVFGLAAKVLLADPAGLSVAPYIQATDTVTVFSGLFLVLGYSFQIYFDFFGYSMMALGLGRLFGIQLPWNFDRPYIALNPRDFWRRWHISLSYWIRDYVYFPLGGNKAYARNIMITFLVCGLWHGAGYSFLVWGGYHGVLVVAYHFAAPVWDRFPKLIQRAVTFSAVSFGWLFFIFTLDEVGFVLERFVVFDAPAAALPAASQWAHLGVAALVAWFVPFRRLCETSIQSPPGMVFGGIALGLLSFVAVTFLNQSQTFIYFRF